MENICNDCLHNQCDDCYESDCQCNLSSHTLAAGLLLRFAAEAVNPDHDVDIQTGNVTIQFLTKDGANDQAEFNLLINGRTYHVTVRA